MFSTSRAVNVLAAARIFLFASRDVWFVVGVPVFLRAELGWTFWQVGTFLAVWVIGYGIVQAAAPRFIRGREAGSAPDGATATWLAFVLAAFPAGIAVALTADADPTVVLVAGLIAFGVVFAANSAVHSYLILAYAGGDRVAMDVGFYYMANAAGRLAGTILSGVLYGLGGARGVPLGVGRVRARRGAAVAAAAGVRGSRQRGIQRNSTRRLTITTSSPIVATWIAVFAARPSPSPARAGMLASARQRKTCTMKT